ncbi:MAG TPA: calcium/proton exchanger [Isosphaeraceae bacterium]|nr:calcium/proton exchanger [Isosphaeraceae bacterium]
MKVTHLGFAAVGELRLLKMNWLLVFVPIAIALDWWGASPILVFAASAVGIVPLAGLMGDATEALAEYLGPTLGGLLNATLGNAPEIIISLFALKRGLIGIVKSSLTGSIIGNLLFGLGVSMFAGGLKVKTQKFDSRVARINGALLVLAAFGLIIPAIYRMSPAAGEDTSRHVSLEIAVILFVVYLGSLVFTLTQKAVMGTAGVKAEKIEAGEPVADVEEVEVGWSRNKALAILAGVTIVLAVMSEVLTGAIDPAAETMGLTPLFAGVFLLALVGNAAELLNAVRFARKDKMDLAIGVTVGASIQVALVVAPILVFAGYFMGQDMNLHFTRFEMWAVVLAVFITRTLIYDGESTWLEGLMLVAIYLMLGFGIFHLPPEAANAF